MRVLVRADSGLREGLMAWCEANGVNYVFGLARNRVLLGSLLCQAEFAFGLLDDALRTPGLVGSGTFSCAAHSGHGGAFERDSDADP